MSDERPGLGALVKNPFMGLLLLGLISGAALLAFAIEPWVGWTIVVLAVLMLLWRFLRWLRIRQLRKG
ncbi:hypothetical protein K8R78_05515 [bacterium]|nr:hypothetical protein [bacterium]